MATVTLMCTETPGLHLGPGAPGSADVIDFIDGYAELDSDSPDFGRKMSWTHTFGCPPIRILDADEVPANAPNAVKCPVCNGAFASERQLNGHILGAHRGKKE